MKIFNTLDRPVVIDQQGRILGGGEHIEVTRRSEEIIKAMDAGWLIRVEEETSTVEEIVPKTDTITTSKRTKKG